MSTSMVENGKGVKSLIADQAGFFDRHQESLQLLGDTLDLPEDTFATLESAVSATQPWVAGDHSRPLHHFSISPEQEPILHGLYQTLGLKDGRPLPSGHYDQIVALGAIHLGNNRRISFLERMISEGGVTTDRVMLLGGQRPIYPEKEKDDIEQNLESLRQKGTEDPWVRSVMADPGILRWETDLIRLAVADHIGRLVLDKLRFRIENREIIEGYDFMWNRTPVTLMHSLAASRPHGEPRHTTESCMADWLERESPPQNATVGFISANPHLERTYKSANYILRQHDRSDIRLVLGGSATPDTAGHGIYLGEVARNLYEDARA